MEKEIPELEKNDIKLENELEKLYNKFSEKQIKQVIYGWLFKNESYRNLEITVLNDPNEGNTAMKIVKNFGLYDQSEEHDGSFKNIFQGDTIEEAIERLENVNNDSDYTDLINFLNSIDLENLYEDEGEKEGMIDRGFVDEGENNELSFEDALDNIREVLKKVHINISNNSEYDAILVKELKADGVIDFNKPLTTAGNTSDIPFTTTQRNMFPYLRIEGVDDENKKQYLKNFFVLQIPVFLNYANLIYLRDNFQEEGFQKYSKRNERLAEINNDLKELSSEEQTILTHTTVFVKNKTRQKDQIGLSQTQTDGPEFTLLRKMLFEHDFFIILKRKLKFEYEIYCVKNKDGEFLPNLIGKFKSNESDKKHTPVLINKFNLKKFSPNRIFFGAPGTGKSFTLNQQKDTVIINDEHFERVTFHPDYSYANFVGTYKPIKEKNKETGKKEITYEFVPGPFLRVFVKAMKNQIEANKNGAELKIYLLIIEEINRANVSAVFGDIFQLLDRDKNNQSEYSINVSEDIKNYLSEEFKEDYKKYFPNNEIKIPNNMYIWATMNSADQGVFPIDTAFKRRWDFEYISINNNYELIKNLEIESKEEIYNWDEVRTAINNYLLKEGINEDKLMGPFFIKENSYKDFTQLFKDKVLMYLYEDAAKPIRDRLFKGSKEKLSSFSYLDICNDFQDRGVQIFNTHIVNEIKTIIKKEKTSGSTLENNHSEEEE